MIQKIINSQKRLRRFLPQIIVTILLIAYVQGVLLPHIHLPLLSYDEAWYAAIAHNMIEDNQIWHQRFNGSDFYDHPPLGFWLMAASMKIFTESEIAVRLPSLLAGIGSLLGLYLFTQKKIGPYLALIPPIMLASSLWFILRVRSGNLDSLLVFFFISTLIAFEYMFKKPQFWYKVIPAGVSLAALLLTKTLVGLGIMPTLILMGLNHPNKAKTMSSFVLAIFCALLLVLPWYLYSSNRYPDFIKYHFVTIGARGGTSQTITPAQLTQTLLYFRSGVGKWYFPVIMSLAITMLAMFAKRAQKIDSFVILAWIIGVGAPFIISSKTEVWHLIPLYVPLFVLTSLVTSWFVTFVPKRLKKYSTTLILIVFLVIGINQIMAILPLLNQTQEVDRKDIALKARQLSAPISMKAAFLPTFVYYSQQENVDRLWADPDSFGTMQQCLVSTDCPTVFVIDNADYDLLIERDIPFIDMDHNNTYRLIQSALIQQ